MNELFNKIDFNSSPLQKINDDFLLKRGITLYLKREDLIHKEISGNKWYKLKYNLKHAIDNGFNTILTFGGAYSNHIYATAAAAKLFGLKSIGIIRGEEILPLNPTLKFATDSGMSIHYVSRKEYRKNSDTNFIEKLKDKFGNFYLIPEGGSNKLAVKGCAEIVNSIEINFDYICAACGTGSTLAGIIAGLNSKNKALGFAVLKGADFLFDDISHLIEIYNNEVYFNWDINLKYHFGGYAKVKPELLSFIDEFESKHNIILEPIYTGKMMYGLYDLIRNNFFKTGTTIIALHSGGLQGLAGLRQRHII